MLYLLGGRRKDHSLVMNLEEYNLATTTMISSTLDKILPNDCLMEIFKYFTDEKALITLTRVCKRFYKLASECRELLYLV
jgi:hypothetical protein